MVTGTAYFALMAAVLCFSLAACGKNSELEKYEKYETLIEYLEAEDYESALAEMVKISENADILENDEQDYFEVQTQMDLYRMTLARSTILDCLIVSS